MTPHEVHIEHGRGGFRPCCGSCMWLGNWSRTRDRAVVTALEHQYLMGTQQCGLAS
jgi:hypothetical protein